MTKAMTARTDVNLFTIDNFLARTKASPGSLEQYRRLLERMEVWLGKPLAAATTTDLERLKADHLTTISSGYHYADLLKIFYRRMKPRREDLEDLKEILTMDRKKPRIARKDLLSPKNVQAMVDVMPALRDKALIACLYETGVRAHELLALTLEDVKVTESPANNGRKIYVLWFKKAKVKGEEHEGYVIEAAKVLEAWLRTRRNGAATDPLFPSWRGGAMGRDGALYVVKAAARRAGIGRRVFNHLLRHSRATYLLANGMKEAQVKALFG
jgi:integrase/recombinase XerD